MFAARAHVTLPHQRGWARPMATPTPRRPTLEWAHPLRPCGAQTALLPWCSILARCFAAPTHACSAQHTWHTRHSNGMHSLQSYHIPGSHNIAFARAILYLHARTLSRALDHYDLHGGEPRWPYPIVVDCGSVRAVDGRAEVVAGVGNSGGAHVVGCAVGSPTRLGTSPTWPLWPGTVRKPPN